MTEIESTRINEPLIRQADPPVRSLHSKRQTEVAEIRLNRDIKNRGSEYLNKRD